MTRAQQDAIIGERVVTDDLNRRDLAYALKFVRDAIGDAWLNDGSNWHPLRELWQRVDFIATQELFSIGDSMILIERLDSAWLKDAIRNIASFDRNNRVGYMFELVAVAALIRGGHRVVPAPPNNKAFDVEADLPNEENGRISIKNFGQSDREQRFQEQARAISAKVQALAAGRTPRWHGIRAICSQYPSDADWRTLEEALPCTVRRIGTSFTAGNWRITLTTPPSNAPTLARSVASHSTAIVAPNAPNEFKNYMDKIEGSMQSLNAASPASTSSTRTILIIRLAESADIQAYTAYAQRYLNGEFSSDPIRLAGVFILQSTVAQHRSEDTTSIAHNISGAWRPGIPAPELKPAMLVGTVSLNSSELLLVINGTPRSLKNHHYFQNSQIYPMQRLQTGAGAEGQIHAIPGFVTHVVWQTPDGRELILSPRADTPDRLTMFQ